MSDSNLHLLYGKGQKQNIVAVETVPKKENIAHVFIRDGNEVRDEYVPYEPFIYLNSEAQIFDNIYVSSDVKIEKLFGSNFYNRRVSSKNYGFIRWVKNNTDKKYMPFLQSQWLASSQETLFKGMDFDDPLRMYLDIEVATKKGYEFPNSSRPEDKVIVVSLSDNRGNNAILSIEEDEWGTTPETEDTVLFANEKNLLEMLVVMIRDWNPDIICGHFIFGFDLPYLRDRCQLHGIKFAIGRNGSEPYTFPTSIKFAEKSDEYENFSVYGRHIIDTYFMAKQYDVVARKLPAYGLKQCVKQLGKASKDRTYIEGDHLAAVWRGEHPELGRKQMLDYALDDVKETQILDQEWGTTIFETTKMIPLPFQDVSRYGTGNKIDLLFLRHYYENMWSWPLKSPEQRFAGGYADTFITGLVDRPMVYIDVGSLYPSLAQILKIQPKKDELELFQKLVHLIKENRYEAKRMSKEAKDEAVKKKYKAMDGSLKILLNTASYGWLSWAWGDFNDYGEAERITKEGQKVVKKMIEGAKEFGSEVCKVDTDGALCTVPDKFLLQEEKFAGLVEDYVNIDGIEIDVDGKYSAAIMFDDKSYCLKEIDGSITIKGNTLKSRSLEPYNIAFIDECIRHIFNKQPEKIQLAFEKWKGMIQNKFMQPWQIAKNATLNKTLEEYKNDLKANENCNPIAHYELAIAADRPYQKGDTIKYYVSEPPLIEKVYKTVPNKWVRKKMAAYEKAKLIEDYANDLDRTYYTKRLEKTLKKFLVILGKEQFEQTYPNVSLLKSDLKKIGEVE